jgi:uncharacterized protein (DUF488 family)
MRGGATVADHKQILLIGYEGRGARDFVQVLHREGVTVLVDVRRQARSRKRGFSKSALRDLLETHGISYCHRPELGPPKDVLAAYRLHQDWPQFEKAYASYIDEGAQDSLAELVRLAVDETVCLMCVEADAARCHRGLLGQFLRSIDRGVPVRAV